jgi:hypothetical protein
MFAQDGDCITQYKPTASELDIMLMTFKRFGGVSTRVKNICTKRDDRLVAEEGRFQLIDY